MRLTTPTLALTLAACAATAPRVRPAAASDPSPGIAAVLDDWHAAAAVADEARYFGHFAPGAVFIGTDATERWDVTAFRAYAHPHFARGRAWRFRAVERHIAVRDGSTAWFDERLATERLGDARGSGVLVLGADGAWRIAQYVLSLPIPNDRFDAVRRLLDVTSSAPPDAASSPSASPPPDASAACATEALPPVLDRYDAIQDGTRFRLELTQDARGAWIPVRAPTMPLHHASTIAWTNAEQLAPHAGHAITVVATGAGRRSLEHDARRATWFATYAARIDLVCPVR